MPNKIYGCNTWSPYTLCAQVIAEAAGAQYEMVWLTEEQSKSADHKKINMTGKFPCLQTDDGTINESSAIGRYFTYGHATLNGSSPAERAKCDEWIQWQMSTAGPPSWPALMAIFGFVQYGEVTDEAFKASLQSIKSNLKSISDSLGDNNFLCGNNITVADYVVAMGFTMAFQTMLDSGFGNSPAGKKAYAWFNRVKSTAAFVKVMGVVQCCAKSLKPILKKVEKKAAPVQQVAAKKAEKPKDDISSLPDTDFDLYNYKTFFVNHKDMRGEAMEECKRMFQTEKFNNGFTYWHMAYDKFGDEGQIQFKFSNLLTGWMQRCDPKLSPLMFGRMLMLGEEPNLDIEGVFMIRGTEIPAMFKDHPQLEYMKLTKLDIVNNADHFHLASQFMGTHKRQVGNGKDTCMGRLIPEGEWFK